MTKRKKHRYHNLDSANLQATHDGAGAEHEMSQVCGAHGTGEGRQFESMAENEVADVKALGMWTCLPAGARQNSYQ